MVTKPFSEFSVKPQVGEYIAYYGHNEEAAGVYLVLEVTEHTCTAVGINCGHWTGKILQEHFWHWAPLNDSHPWRYHK